MKFTRSQVRALWAIATAIILTIAFVCYVFIVSTKLGGGQ